MPADQSTRETNLTIGLFSAYYPPHMGGVEQFTQNLAHTLSAMGHRVVVVACNTEACPDVEAEDDLFEVHRIPAANLGGRYPLPLRNAAAASHWIEIAAIPFDAIVVNTRFYPLSLMGAKLACEKGLKPIVIEHGSSHLTIGNAAVDAIIARYEHAVSSKLRSYSPLGYGVSQEASAWMSHFGIEAKGVIHNAIDAAAFRACASTRDFRQELDIPADADIAVFTGRLISEKGVWCVADAATHFSASGAVHFVIAGEGPEFDALSAKAPTNVHLVGRLSREDVSALLQQADIFCFPSTYPEGLPTSLLEAASCGCYLMTTNIAGASEIIADENMGCILPDAGAKALADALDRALADPESIKSAGIRCQAHVEREFSWQASTHALLEAIAGVAAS